MFKNIYNKWQSTKKRLASYKMSRKEIFTNIYLNNEWGGEKNQWYSGLGSYREDFVKEYTDYICRFIDENNIKSICDLGCGDYHIASNFAHLVGSYMGVDIVEGLIERNKKEFETESIKFCCKDIVQDDIPHADLCLIRQVLQHLTNKEIISVLDKCKQYKYVIVTEHVFCKERASSYNCEISPLRTTRKNNSSGIYLDEAPFSMHNVQIVRSMKVRDDEDLLMYLIIN